MALSGIHPRSEKTIQATQDWERGRIGSARLKRRFQDDVKELLTLQDTLGFDFLSDGQLTELWQDQFTPIVLGTKGIKKGPLVRWFNTNTFYYVPVIEGDISYDGNRAREIAGVKPVGQAQSKVVLPDPITFAECSDNRHYSKREDLIFAYCDGVLSPLLRSLESSGVGYVQFSAPGLVARFRGERLEGAESSQAAEGLRSALRGCHLRTGYHTFFGDAAEYLPFLYDLVPTDDVGFDLTETDPSGISSTEKGILAGVASARSSFVESPEDLVRRLDGLIDKTKRLTLAPSCDLRYIPRVVADEKLKNLARARRKLA